MKREEYLTRLMQPPNSIWTQVLAQASVTADVLKQPEVIKSIQNVLQVI